MNIRYKDKKTLRKFTHDLIFYIKKLFYVIFSKRRAMDNMITRNIKQIQNTKFMVRVSNIDPYTYIESLDRLILKDIVIEVIPSNDREYNEKLEKRLNKIIDNGEQLKTIIDKRIDITYNIHDIGVFLKFTRDIEYKYKYTIDKMEQIINNSSDTRFNTLLSRSYELAIYHMKAVIKLIQDHIIAIRLAVTDEVNNQSGNIEISETINLLSDHQYNEILESVIIESDSKYINDMMSDFRI